MTKKIKILCNLLGILFLLLFTSCTTKYGGINGTGVKLSIGYILCNSIVGSIVLFINAIIILASIGDEDESLRPPLIITFFVISYQYHILPFEP